MADNETADTGDANETQELKGDVETKAVRRSYKYDDPPVVFKDVDVCVVSLSFQLLFLSLNHNMS